jgi:hypothetical protein
VQTYGVAIGQNRRYRTKVFEVRNIKLCEEALEEPYEMRPFFEVLVEDTNFVIRFEGKKNEEGVMEYRTTTTTTG